MCVCVCVCVCVCMLAKTQDLSFTCGSIFVSFLLFFLILCPRMKFFKVHRSVRLSESPHITNSVPNLKTTEIILITKKGTKRAHDVK